MAEEQKKVLKALSDALPHMSEKQKGYFLGYAEAVSDMSAPEEKTSPPKNMDRYGLKVEE